MARRPGDVADGLWPLHMVSAFLVREGLTLAQEVCDVRSNEITAIPRLLDHIHLEEPWLRSTPPDARPPSCRPCGRPTPTTCWLVKGILRWAALNLLRTIQRRHETHVSIGLPRFALPLQLCVCPAPQLNHVSTDIEA